MDLEKGIFFLDRYTKLVKAVGFFEKYLITNDD